MKLFQLLILMLFCSISGFSQNWESINNGLSAGVRSIFVDSIDNMLYLGGHFIYADTLEVNGLVKFDGDNFYGLGGGLDVCGSNSCNPILAISRYQNDIYASITSPNIGGVSASGIAKWDGVNWSIVGNDNLDGVIYDLQVYDNELYVMGIFDIVELDTISTVAKWNGAEWSSINFPSSISGDSYVNCFTLFEGDYYFGGNFKVNIEGEVTNSILKWDGENWYPVAGGILGNFKFVQDIIVYKNELYIAGQFFKSAGNAGNGIMKLQGDTWVDVGGSLDVEYATINNMVIYDDELYVMGTFEYVAGIEVWHIAKWNGTEWCSLGSQLNNGCQVGAIYNDELYVGGYFNSIDTDTFNFITKWIGGDYVEECGAIVSTIESEIQLSNFELFPNPAINQTMLSVKCTEASSAQVYISDMHARVVSANNIVFSKGLNYSRIDLKNLSSGVYFLHLQLVTGEIFVEKIVVF